MCTSQVNGSGWKRPEANGDAQPTLRLHNSLTKSAVPFVPASGTRRVTWYSCGPTVYDAAHIGHARNYLTFDILRRVMSDYFGYDVFFVQNITDIDDKIILRARQAHLFRQFRSAHPTFDAALAEYLPHALLAYAKSKLGIDAADIGSLAVSIKALELKEEDAKGRMHQSNVLKALDAWQRTDSATSPANLLDAMEDIVAAKLDEERGASVTDQRIFKELALFWERDFEEDMRQLNVLEPDVKTRVSEFIPEIIECIRKIMENGYAYASQGSVYFDVDAFAHQHAYAKLCPQHAGNSKFFEEGEGTLGIKLSGKRDPRDFALWKCSKPGEPLWESPWGLGRPGWHIECSAMAASIIPGTLDLHSGGIDLQFPHHDNEMAQSEAASNCQQWVNYFLHAGHVHIEGHKMSKSLKNFITIKECLRTYMPRQLRLLFLQHAWNQPLTYKESAMSAALACEQTLVHFFATVAAILREIPPDREHHWTSHERELSKALATCQHAVHGALCDNIDTPRALAALLDLVSRANQYLKGTAASVHPSILASVARYLMHMLQVFGLSFSDNNASSSLSSTSASLATTNGTLQSLAERVSRLRDSLRSQALQGDLSNGDVLRACDDLRDDLVDFGVVLEDRVAGQASLVKLLSPEQVQQARQEQQRTLEERLQKMQLAQEKLEAKRRQAAIDPRLMFRSSPELYGQFDEEGVPTHDPQGVELGKNARKRLLKDFELQCDLHDRFLAGKL